MKTFLRENGETGVVELEGDVDLASSPELRETLFQGLRDFPRLAIDLKSLRYIDSSGIAVLLETLKEAQRLGRSLVLFGVGPAVQEVFKLTHVTRIFRIADTEEQAVATP